MNSLHIAVLMPLLLNGHLMRARTAELSTDQEKILETARAAALQYTQKLPDFICTQTTQREFSNLGEPEMGFAGVRSGVAVTQLSTPDAGAPVGVIEEKLTFFNQKENYEVIAIGGKKVSGIDHMALQGAISAGEFGSALNQIFNPESHTVFTWRGTEKLHRRLAYVFDFHVPKEGGTVVIHRGSGRQIVVSYRGQVSLDATTLAVLRITSSLDLPRDFPIERFASSAACLS